jgi:pimeloyl-ACP methyl ester carboxylesterase
MPVRVLFLAVYAGHDPVACARIASSSTPHAQEWPMTQAPERTTDQPGLTRPATIRTPAHPIPEPRAAEAVSPPPPETRSGVAGGVSYWRYRTGGTGPRRGPIIVLHGLGADHVGLREFVQHIPAVDVVELDLPGFGQSAPLPGRHTIIGYAHAVEDLRVRLGLESVNLVGHSIGADIALAHAGLYPTRVRALALLHPVIDSGGPTASLARAYYRIASRLPDRLARVWLLSRPAIYVSDMMVFTTKDRERRRQIIDNDYRTAAAASPRAISEVCLSIPETPFYQLARQIVVPTLMVTGSRDSLTGRRTLDALRPSIARARDVVVDGAGHLWPVEEPRAAADLVAANLR